MKRTRNEELTADVHSLSAGLKAYTTAFTNTALSVCRECCGGHGYAAGERNFPLWNLMVGWLYGCCGLNLYADGGLAAGAPASIRHTHPPPVPIPPFICSEPAGCAAQRP